MPLSELFLADAACKSRVVAMDINETTPPDVPRGVAEDPGCSMWLSFGVGSR